MSLEFSGEIPLQHLVMNASTLGTCEMYWTDPTPDIINGIRELGFRTAIVATNTSTNQTFLATETANVPVYTSNYAYLAAALVVMFLGIFLVFPTFLGWWNLGRKVSLSPIAIARAFNAPMLADSGANGTDKALLEEVGDMEVKYGEVDGGEGLSLQMARPDVVGIPRAGVSYNG